MSSFQLDHVATFRPRVAVLLNVTPDHLDRYDHSLDRYAASKMRVFENARPGRLARLQPRRRPACGRPPRRTARAHAGRRSSPCSPSRPTLPQGAYVRTDADGAERIVLALPAPAADGPTSPPNVTESFMPTADLALPGRHNLYDSLAAAVVARAMEIRSDIVRESLTSFEGVPHRLEKVRTLGGVAYVNDSKATNVNAVWYALESFAGPPRGGPRRPHRRRQGQGQRLRPAEAARRGQGGRRRRHRRERRDGRARARPARAARSPAASMEEAIQFARLMAEPGDTVLLSPACASFDMFDNYEDRGDTFKRLVHAL